MTPNMKIAYDALVEFHECEHAPGWGCVYLDNAHARCPSDWSGLKWSAILANLARIDMYSEIDDPDFKGDFGLVKLPTE